MSNLIDRVEAQTAIQLVSKRYTVAHEAHGEGVVVWSDCLVSVTDVMDVLRNLPPTQPEYEPVTAEDFARTMSENSVYSYMTWYGTALALMERQWFVICKKTI